MTPFLQPTLNDPFFEKLELKFEILTQIWAKFEIVVCLAHILNKFERSNTKLTHFYALCTLNAPILTLSTPNDPQQCILQQICHL